jgi:hypothetical protein
LNTLHTCSEEKQKKPVSIFHPSVREILHDLRGKYPDTPFLALGQTVWWDEPMKAILLLMLHELGLGGKMTVGVHDTDYFAKVSVRLPGQSRWELLPHNDGSTQDLWSAAGEISRFFGSESYPTRHNFTHYGVPFRKLVRCQGKDRLEFLNEITEAWGWRGLVYTGSRNLIVHSMPLHDMEGSVERMLEWGFTGTEESIADNGVCKRMERAADQMMGWVREFAASHPNATLSELYQHVLPLLYDLLLGDMPRELDVACSAHMLILNPETASLPRFRFVDLFLNEKTRSIAVKAYNDAVAGSEIYTLDRFGLGALPFDLVLPGHGRGTLRITLRAIHVETPTPIRIPLKKPINCIQELAEILTRELGDHVTLVGKAVALISMLSSEFIFVFNEEGSGYVTRTRKMHQILRENGIEHKVHPLLRMRYYTWDALEVEKVRLRLPSFLAATFGGEIIPAVEFARNWKSVVESQGELLKKLKELRAPRDLMQYLAERHQNGWSALLDEYNKLKMRLREIRRRGLALQYSVNRLYDELKDIKASIRDTELAKGDHFRSVIDWTPEETQIRERFDRDIAALLARRKDLLARIRDIKSEREALERQGEAALIRDRITTIEVNAEMERMAMIRNAILTRKGLVHTQHRPAAWWIPMVDPSGEWFRRIVSTTELYLEPLE